MRALREVDDPEYPGVSVLDMGMIGEVEVTEGRVRVELIPTFSGCPAFAFIEADVARAAASVNGVTEVAVERSGIAWSTDRLSERARRVMAREFTVAVAVAGQPLPCPRCGSAALAEQSAFGSVRCRAVHRCADCGEAVETLRA